MEVLIVCVGVVFGLLVLDATVGRWLLRLSTTFRLTSLPGGAPESRTLLVYLPGILFDGDESVAEVKEALLAPVASAMFVSYGFWRFIPKRVLSQTAGRIGHSPRDNSKQQYDSVVLLGASFGGRVAADLAFKLQTEYGWEPSAIKVIMVDTPCENNSFQQPGLTVSLVMRWLFIGPLVSVLALWGFRRSLVPPFDVDIEPGLNFSEVKRKAVDRMAKFRLSSVCDQQRYLADDNIQWTMGLTGLDVVYLWCDNNNITVVQPAAMRKVELFTKDKVNHFTWQRVPSPHCGFAQLPGLWQETFSQVLARTVSSR